MSIDFTIDSCEPSAYWAQWRVLIMSVQHSSPYSVILHQFPIRVTLSSHPSQFVLHHLFYPSISYILLLVSHQGSTLGLPPSLYYVYCVCRHINQLSYHRNLMLVNVPATNTGNLSSFSGFHIIERET